MHNIARKRLEQYAGTVHNMEMDRIPIDPFEYLPEIMERLQKPGLLLSSGQQGNLMTIGWGTVGIVWKRPVFTVLVRPSRFSFELLRKNGNFSVCVPDTSSAHARAVAWCGTNSGRDGDKYKATGLTAQKGIINSIPYVKEFPIHYECRPLHVNHVLDAEIDGVIREQSYPEGNFHQIWWGEILGCWKKPEE